MRTGGSEPDKKTAGKQTVQSDYVVNSQLEVSGTGDRKTGGGEKTDARDRQTRLKIVFNSEGQMPQIICSGRKC